MNKPLQTTRATIILGIYFRCWAFNVVQSVDCYLATRIPHFCFVIRDELERNDRHRDYFLQVCKCR